MHTRRDSSRKRFTIKPLCSAIITSLAAYPVLTLANPTQQTVDHYIPIATNPIYHPRLTLNAQVGSYGFAQVDYMYPLFSRSHFLFLLDARYQASTQNSQEANLGLVYRQLLFCNQNILGAYAWVDRSKSPEHKYFNQATLGGEFLGNIYDFRANIYLPYGNKSQSLSPFFTGTVFANTIGVIQHDSKEKALPGFDVEVGREVPGFSKLRAFIDYFSFGVGNDPKVHGERARIEYQYHYNLIFTASYSYDNIRQGVGFVGFRVSLGGVDHPVASPMVGRMEDFVIRDIDIVSVKQAGPTQLIADTRTYWFVNDISPAGGNGTYEHPFNTVSEAETASGIGDAIYTFQGNALYALPNGGLNLKMNQLLTGSGGNLMFHNTIIIPATSAPQLNGRINVNDGDVLSNFTLTGKNTIETTGIYGNNVNNVNLTNLTIQDFKGSNANGADSTGYGYQSGGTGGTGSDAFGIQLIDSTNVSIENTTVTNIIGGDANGGNATSLPSSSSYSNYGYGGSGGTGGNATGIDLSGSSASLNNINIVGISGGSAKGGDGSVSSNSYYTYRNRADGGNAGTGGDAKGLDLTGGSGLLSNINVSHISGGSVQGGTASCSGAYSYNGNDAIGGSAGTGGRGTAIDLTNAVADLTHISISNVLGGAAVGGDAQASGSSNHSYGGNGGSGGDAIGINATNATITTKLLNFNTIVGGSADAGTGGDAPGAPGIAGNSTDIKE